MIKTDLEAAIQYQFKNPLLLEEALTHRSFLNETAGKGTKDNERLEFFGDAVLDFVLSRRLLERFPESREGELTRMRSSLVDEDSLAELAGALGLGQYLLLGKGEDKSGGRQKKSILANAYEALLAAIYLDGGPEPVERLIDRQFEVLMQATGRGTSGRDSKTEFQELCQSVRGATPEYRLTGSSGPDHARSFNVSVYINGECLGEGEGRSKKEAEQAAARQGLVRLRNETSADEEAEKG